MEKKKKSKIRVLTRKTVDFEARNEAHRAKHGGHGVRAEESFLNWGHMRETDTHSQSYGQISAAHSKIAPIRPDYDFLPILR
jgi:ribosome assembly protein YihI (activator of Der GTPase)